MTEFIPLPKNAKDISGQRFGRLVALGPVGFRSGNGRRVLEWLCLCDCGEQRLSHQCVLKNGRVQSCGCMRREAALYASQQGMTHGATRSPEWRSWQSMLQRCENPKNTSYASYGGRGIRVCNRWKKFENFRDDMGNRPSLKHSIDRIDVNGNYEPGNCRWATPSEQGLHLRRNVIVEAFDRKGALCGFFPEGSQSKQYEFARKRIHRGWDAEKAIKAALIGVSPCLR